MRQHPFSFVFASISSTRYLRRFRYANSLNAWHYIGGVRFILMNAILIKCITPGCCCLLLNLIYKYILFYMHFLYLFCIRKYMVRVDNGFDIYNCQIMLFYGQRTLPLFVSTGDLPNTIMCALCIILTDSNIFN